MGNYGVIHINRSVDHRVAVCFSLGGGICSSESPSSHNFMYLKYHH